MEILQWLVHHSLGRVIDRAMRPGTKLLSSLLPRQDIEKLRLQLSHHFKDKVEIYCFNKFEPKIHVKGKHSLTTEQLAKAIEIKQQLDTIGHPNDPHALLANNPLWASDPVNFEVTTLDYSEVCALRQDGLSPQIVSAGGVLLCREKEELILHRRGREGDVATYPDALHILGGAYMPDGIGVSPDRSGLRSTAVREING